uniref:Uncharacterized protein n=1 Tax=Lepeophtheirus salmonis TaxID=72036 RepID=A0A0K2U6C7_LEPSM
MRGFLNMKRYHLFVQAY